MSWNIFFITIYDSMSSCMNNASIWNRMNIFNSMNTLYNYHYFCCLYLEKIEEYLRNIWEKWKIFEKKQNINRQKLSNYPRYSS